MSFTAIITETFILGGLIFFGDFIMITDELPNYFLDYRERLSGDTRWSP